MGGRNAPPGLWASGFVTVSTLLRRVSLPSCARMLGFRSGISESVVDAEVYAEIGRRSPRTGLGI